MCVCINVAKSNENDFEGVLSMLNILRCLPAYHCGRKTSLACMGNKITATAICYMLQGPTFAVESNAKFQS
jgi:hypothetical protein